MNLDAANYLGKKSILTKKQQVNQANFGNLDVLNRDNN